MPAFAVLPEKHKKIRPPERNTSLSSAVSHFRNIKCRPERGISPIRKARLHLSRSIRLLLGSVALTVSISKLAMNVIKAMAEFERGLLIERIQGRLAQSMI